MNAQIERRNAARVSTQFKADVVVLTGKHAGEELTGNVVDISRDGLGLVVPGHFMEGDQLGFVIFSDGYESLCVGHVVWNKTVKESTRYGLKISRWSYLDPSLALQLNSPRFS